MITLERLRELMRYDPETGVFIRNKARKGFRAETVVGGPDRGGYIAAVVDGKHYRIHRLAWLYMTGEWPPADIDHVNGNCADNRWANIRKASRSQNMMNARRRSNNTSGLKGVDWDVPRRKWRAQIRINGRTLMLGRFDDRDAAHAAYVAKARELFGEFARIC